MSSQIIKERLLIPEQAYLYTQETHSSSLGRQDLMHMKFLTFSSSAPHQGSAMPRGLLCACPTIIWGERHDVLSNCGPLYQCQCVNCVSLVYNRYRRQEYAFRISYSNLLRHHSTSSVGLCFACPCCYLYFTFRVFIFSIIIKGLNL